VLLLLRLLLLPVVFLTLINAPSNKILSGIYDIKGSKEPNNLSRQSPAISLTASNFSANCFNIALKTFGTSVSNSKSAWAVGTRAEEGGSGSVCSPLSTPFMIAVGNISSPLTGKTLAPSRWTHRRPS
jgi:hypothetical protein